MKKYLIFILFAIITSTATANWHGDFVGCAIFTRAFALDDYYFCGAHEAKCENDWAEEVELNKSVKWFEDGDPQELGGDHRRYYCCFGKVTSKPTKKKGSATGTPGKWVRADEKNDWYKKIESKTINITGGGTCTYNEYTDVCDRVTDDKDKVCKEQLEKNIICPEGQFFRESSQSCAPQCETGYAYESAKSNKCVACPETNTQGVVDDGYSTNYKLGYPVEPAHRICRKCDATNSFLDANTKQCVQKLELKNLSTVELQYGKNARTRGSAKVTDQCWTKYDNEYKDCVLQNYTIVTATPVKKLDSKEKKITNDITTFINQNNSGTGNNSGGKTGGNGGERGDLPNDNRWESTIEDNVYNYSI